MDDNFNTGFANFISGIEELFIPELENGFERPPRPSDYSSYLKSCDKKFEKLLIFSENCDNFKDIDVKLKQKCLTSALILLGEHSKPSLWTTDVTIRISKALVEKLLVICGHSDVSDALISCNGHLFDKVLKVLRPRLLKETWKNNAAAILCYSWTLKLIESPNLAEHLNKVLPTALLLVDDFVLENRKLGLTCIEHIIINVGRTHLCWYAQDEVILKALEPLVFFKEEELIEPLINVLMLLLKKKYPQRLNVELLIEDFDPIINIILHNMMFEQRLKIRSAYAKVLPSVIRERGLGMLLHSVALLKVINEYVLEPTSSAEGIQILKCFVEVCWPRIHLHVGDIFSLICKVYIGYQHKRYPYICEEDLREVVHVLQKLCTEELDKKRNDIMKYDSLLPLRCLLDY